ncbi:MAG: prepilin-type N-terminal cleavage/methylation domain-containing protein, partial [Deltaproteobacteria bacterium]|nr:prepilin-type N-terminal cleavage/methylation domain-containing protein [Deltaproteobacteria bacterium]
MNAAGNRLARFTGRQAGVRRRTGFTLLELVLVVMIIGILAGITTYTYRMMVNKAR